MTVYQYILRQKHLGKHLLAVLLDPEHPIPFRRGELNRADLIFVGGSTGAIPPQFIGTLRKLTSRPIILFPGNEEQFSSDADALLFLSVLSSRNADLLIGRQVAMAQRIHHTEVEVLPLGYILVDGGKKTSVVRASHSLPIPQSEIETIVDTALAGEMMGKQLIYLEAGSGAKNPVSIDIIRAVRGCLSVPLIVGGGITTPAAMNAAFAAGADIVVIGNHFEQHPEDLQSFR